MVILLLIAANQRLISRPLKHKVAKYKVQINYITKSIMYFYLKIL